jgi:hypothetical protein
MKMTGRTAFGGALFLVVAGFCYALTGTFSAGFPLLMVAAVGVALLGSHVALAVRRAEQEVAAGDESADEVEPHVGPTIWPLGYALSAVGGIVFFALILVQARAGELELRQDPLQAASIYWNFVTVIGVALYLIFYLANAGAT